MPSGAQQPSEPRPAGPGRTEVLGDVPGAARGRAAAVREQSRRLRREAADTRAELAERRTVRPFAAGDPSTGAPTSDWRSRLAAAEDRSAQLQRALASNRRIGIAIGVLMTRLQVTDVEAFELLRRTSQRRNVKLHRLAEDVICTGSL